MLGFPKVYDFGLRRPSNVCFQSFTWLVCVKIRKISADMTNGALFQETDRKYKSLSDEDKKRRKDLNFTVSTLNRNVQINVSSLGS